MQHIHVSDIRAFKQCRLRWHFSSPLRMGLSSKYPATSMWLGTLVHEILDRYYASDRQIDWRMELEYFGRQQVAHIHKYFGPRQDLIEKYVELQEEVSGILENYFLKAEELDQGLTWVATEEPFQIQLTDDLVFAGRFDAIVRDYNNVWWVLDHKTTKIDFNDYVSFIVDRDDQARAYVWALQQMYPKHRVGGIIYNLIRSKAPEKPAVLKRGGLSRNANQDTTWEMYRQAIAENGFREEDYIDMQQILLRREAERPYFARVPITFTEQSLKWWGEHTKEIAQQMAGNPLIYPQQMMFTCRGCAFREPCAAYLNSGWLTAQQLLDNNYVTSKYAEEALERAAADVFSVEIVE